MVVETKEIPQSQDIPLEKGQSSDAPKVTPKLKTYSEAEHLKAVSDERTVSGRLKTQLEKATKERDTFKSQVDQLIAGAEKATAANEETKATIAQLEEDLETLGDGNLDAAEVLKIKKELRAEKAKLVQEFKVKEEANALLEKTLEKEREEWAGTVAETQAAKFEVDVFEVAEDYVDEAGKDIKPEKLKSLCEKAGKNKREEIIELADVLWSKKAEPTNNEPALIEDSGVTNGGRESLEGKSVDEKLSMAYKRKR